MTLQHRPVLSSSSSAASRHTTRFSPLTYLCWLTAPSVSWPCSQSTFQHFSPSLCRKLHHLSTCRQAKIRLSPCDRLILYTPGHSAPQLRFHISPQSTCEAAEQSSVKWQSPRQLHGLAAVVKPAQQFLLSGAPPVTTARVLQSNKAKLEHLPYKAFCGSTSAANGEERIIHLLVSDLVLTLQN